MSILGLIDLDWSPDWTCIASANTDDTVHIWLEMPFLQLSPILDFPGDPSLGFTLDDRILKRICLPLMSLFLLFNPGWTTF